MRYHFSVDQGKCLPFVFKGCGGNRWEFSKLFPHFLRRAKDAFYVNMGGVNGTDYVTRVARWPAAPKLLRSNLGRTPSGSQGDISIWARKRSTGNPACHPKYDRLPVFEVDLVTRSWNLDLLTRVDSTHTHDKVSSSNFLSLCLSFLNLGPSYIMWEESSADDGGGGTFRLG